MYDIIIVGAGVIGAAIARSLAKYDVRVLVIEKNSDVGDETSGANSAIVHSGYDPHNGTLKAELNVRGNALFPQLCRELDVELKTIGSLTVALNDDELRKLEELRENGLANGVETEIISREKLLEMEPFVTKKAVGALLAPTAGIINPFELVVALMENAMDNGVELHLEEKVTSICAAAEGYTVSTEKGTYETRIVINCAGVRSGEINNMVCKKKETIRPRKGEYFVLDHFTAPYVSHTLFSLPSDKGKGVLVSPTTHGNYLIGPSSEFVGEDDDKGTDAEILANVLEQAHRLVDDIPMQHLIREFSGLRAYHDSGDFVMNSPRKGFINMLGIQSPGLASSPAIAERAVEMVKEVMDLAEKKDFNAHRRPMPRLNTLSAEERSGMIRRNPDFGQMVCRCEQVSKGEVIDCIRRNCGARTVKGVKKRVRPGFGKCQGGFCEPLIMKILSDELGISLQDVKYKSRKSYILSGRTKSEE